MKDIKKIILYYTHKNVTTTKEVTDKQEIQQLLKLKSTTKMNDIKIKVVR